MKCKPIEQVNYLAGHKLMAMTKRYDHANEERYGEAIEALDEAGKTSSAEASAAVTCCHLVTQAVAKTAR